MSTCGPELPPDHQLWIQAREDVYIDAVLAEAQWRRWGEPHIPRGGGAHRLRQRLGGKDIQCDQARLVRKE
jgi:hypothetical protein